MLLALRLLYERTQAQILFPVIGGKRKRKLRPVVEPLFRQDVEVVLSGSSVFAQAGAFSLSGTAKVILAGLGIQSAVGTLTGEADGLVSLKGVSMKLAAGYDAPFSSVRLGETKPFYSDDEDALTALFLGGL